MKNSASKPFTIQTFAMRMREDAFSICADKGYEFKRARKDSGSKYVILGRLRTYFLSRTLPAEKVISNVDGQAQIRFRMS